MVNPRENIKYDIPKEWVENFKKGCCPVCAKTKFEFDKGMKVYCSPKCRELYGERIYTWQEKRDKILKKNGKKCEKCFKTQKQLSKYKDEYKIEQKKKYLESHPELLEQRRKELMEEAEEKYQQALNLKPEDLFLYREIPELPWSYDTFEVDHITPVALGGDMFDEENLQVLCYTCHKEKTKKDMKEIANLRKREKNRTKGLKEEFAKEIENEKENLK